MLHTPRTPTRTSKTMSRAGRRTRLVIPVPTVANTTEEANPTRAVLTARVNVPLNCVMSDHFQSAGNRGSTQCRSP